MRHDHCCVVLLHVLARRTYNVIYEFPYDYKYSAVCTHSFVDDVTDGGGVVPAGQRPLEEGQEGGVVHVDLVDLVKYRVDDAAVKQVLALHWNQVFLKYVQNSSFIVYQNSMFDVFSRDIVEKSQVELRAFVCSLIKFPTYF